MSEARRLAAIDIGTVTTRLLVADVSDEGITEVVRSTDITHLGEDLSSTGRLSEEAMERVSVSLSEYVTAMADSGVERCVAIATSASRDAENADDFSARAVAAGVDIEIVEGNREAELSFRGATYQHTGEGLLVIDCGGGSTELILGSSHGSDAEIVASRSFDIGSRRMTERFLHSDPPSRADLDAARSWAAGEMRGYFDRLDERPHQAIGLAGTATTLAAIRLGLAEYDAERVHGYDLAGSDIADLLEMLASMPLERRLSVVGLHPGRAGVIVAGALILETVLGLAGLGSMVVSEHDILYGILLDTYDDLLEST